MSFTELLVKAKAGDSEALQTLLTVYEPLLHATAVHDNTYDEDLYQELCITFMRCIAHFDPNYLKHNEFN